MMGICCYWLMLIFFKLFLFYVIHSYSGFIMNQGWTDHVGFARAVYFLGGGGTSICGVHGGVP